MTDIELLELAAKAAGGVSSDGLGHCYDLGVLRLSLPLLHTD